MKPDELKLFLADKLAAFKIPLQIEFSDSILPRLASGKFDKPQLRKEFETKFNKAF
jgi:long-chain acyl-CoA synthetase